MTAITEKHKAKVESMKKQISDLKNLNQANYNNGYKDGFYDGWGTCKERVAFAMKVTPTGPK